MKSHKFGISISVLIGVLAVQARVGAAGPGDLLVTGAYSNSVPLYDGQKGKFIEEFVPGFGGLFGPGGSVFGPDGNLYLLADLSQRVLRYDGKTGAFSSPRRASLTVPPRPVGSSVRQE